MSFGANDSFWNKDLQVKYCHFVQIKYQQQNEPHYFEFVAAASQHDFPLVAFGSDLRDRQAALADDQLVRSIRAVLVA